jgi:MFS transporter, OFA family, oxalate/formate antiporter
VGQGLVVLALSFFLRSPTVKLPAPKKASRHLQTRVDYTPGQMVRKPVFYLLYLMFVMVASGGLIAAAQIGPIAHDFGVADTPVTLLGITMGALTFAISLDRIFDGIGRPFFGWVSDTIGRENTMFIAFGLAAVALSMLVFKGNNPLIFVVFSALFFGVFGEIYSLFPATSGDTFGSRFAATNNGLLYTAKGTAALLVPLASLVSAAYGWYAVFAISVCLNAIAALLALFVLKPLRRRFIESGHVSAETPRETVPVESLA